MNTFSHRMKSGLCASLALAAAFASQSALARDVVFSCSPADAARGYRIIPGPDETMEVKTNLTRQVMAEVKRITGIEVEFLWYSCVKAGDFYVTTQPWDAKGAYRIVATNGVVGIHGSDPQGTEAALRWFIDNELKPRKEGETLTWRGLVAKSGPQYEDVREAALAKVRAKRAAEKAPDWENELVNYVNVLPARNCTFPLASKEAAFTPEIPETPYVKPLDGVWKLEWYGNPSLRKPGFEAEGFDDSGWFDIEVPSCLEIKGFGTPHYTNITYPHPANPPYTDRANNHVAHYRTKFDIPDAWKGRKTVLRFEGVYSAYNVWVNGKKAGYSEDSCTAHEFDVTALVRPSGNVLAVEVFRWSDGSYLEDQDFFRYSGIFRSVKLFSPPKNEIRDFFAAVDLVNGYRDAVVELSADSSLPCRAELFDAEYKSAGVFENGRLTVRGARLWSAEDPYLYTLVVENGEDVRSHKIGMRKTELAENGAILVNGRPVKFKGVNRHETSPDNGRSVTKEEMLADILLMKRHNIDTIRTSHYPDDPYFYHLCDRYGIYVQAEANVESHGMGYGLKTLASPPSWRDAHVARCRDMVLNWRNNACVFMWSWGNEAGQGQIFDDVYAECAKADSTRPACYRQDCERCEFDGPCYMALKWTRQCGGWPKTNFAFEYAHAMGNALGGFADYWDEFYKYDSWAGGCIWEWVDHSIWKYTDRTGPDGRRERYLAYGGDFDDTPNDGPFCCNGVVGAERKITPKLLEVKHVQRNIAVSGPVAEDGTVEVWNRFVFTPSSKYAASWTLLENGSAVAGGAWDVPETAPKTRLRAKLPAALLAFPRDPSKEYFANVAFALREDCPWAGKGHVVAEDQIALGGKFVPPAATAGGSVEVAETPDGVTVSAGGTRAVFSRRTGTLSRLEMDGAEVLSDSEDGIVRGPRFTCQRAFVDNDKWLRGWNEMLGLTQLRYHARPLSVVRSGGAVKVKASVKVTGTCSAGYEHAAEYVFAGDGTVEIRNDVDPFGKQPKALPRMGLSWMLSPALENVEWYGRGPHENYCDRKSSAFVGRYRSTVAEQYVEYVHPQDNGYKSDVRWLALTDDSGRGVRISSDAPFFFKALHYSLEDLRHARHDKGQPRVWNVKPPRREVCLDVDCRQTGLGNSSCGPSPEEPYRFPVERTRWTLRLAPARAAIR